MLFTDEAMTYALDPRQTHVWRTAHESICTQLYVPVIKYGGYHVMVFGGASYNYMTDLYIFPTGVDIDGAEYIRALRAVVKPVTDVHPELMFELDGAGLHRANIVKDYLNQNILHGYPLYMHPANSPDLAGAIEYVWRLLKN